MATIDPIEYDDASAEVQAIYDEIMEARGTDTINAFWKIAANHPPTLRRVWESLKEVMAPGALDPLTKEMIAIAVSATNGCSYCVNSHTTAAIQKGLTKEMHGELMAVIGLFNTTNKLVEGYQVEPDVFPKWE